MYTRKIEMLVEWKKYFNIFKLLYKCPKMLTLIIV